MSRRKDKKSDYTTQKQKLLVSAWSDTFNYFTKKQHPPQAVKYDYRNLDCMGVPSQTELDVPMATKAV